ncbi:serine hydrolase [Clostridium sp. MSJ-4]|uniref:Serine hydrolase n=1 Tax=Clostridium simiarum TaxID=2841506 RepID=A0ABS6EVC1_9CLOT|nr:serine hydrolase [Clostridium simiarum]MBU5590172.1 serine hydrolase [Clostridium simiarum]
MEIKEKIIKDLDRIINEYIKAEFVPGLAVGVVYNNEVIYTKGFGVKNIDTKEPVDENSLFHMASVSKTFVATGIMQLVEQGKINLDKCLIEYLPYFKLKDERYKNITIRQILNHTSGMPDEEDYEWDKPKYDDKALERYVRSVDGRELMWEPGEKFAYSNIAYEILGHVIEKVSGMSFEEYMKENILDVVKMKESNFLKPLVSKDLLTSPHILDVKNGYGATVSEVFPYNRAHGPSSTLCSNVVEMCNYAIANINEGRFQGDKILKNTSYSELWREYASTEWGGYTSKIGLSWFLGQYKGNKVMSHSGMDTGFRSNLIILPERGIAVVVMINAYYIGTKILCTSILDILLGEEVHYIKTSLAQHIIRTMFNNNSEIALKEYDKIKQNSIERYLVYEDEFNAIAYQLLERKRVKEAIDVLKISIEIFKESANLYDSLGEMYLCEGNKKLALESYKKSVELDPNNENGKKMIEELSV